MKRCLKFIGRVAISAAVSTAVTYVMTRVHDVRGFEVPGSEGCACGGVNSGSFRSKCGVHAQKSEEIGSFLNRDESALAELRKNYCAFGCVSGCPALEDAGFGKTCALAFGEYCPGPGLNGTRDTSLFESADADDCSGDSGDVFEDFDSEDEFEDFEESYEDEELWVESDDAEDEDFYEDDELGIEPEDSDEDGEPEKESDDVGDEGTSFCPYGEIGCLSPLDFDGAMKTCPCASIGNCLRQHTVVKPASDAFGGSYGGHGLHAEQVAFGGKDVSGDAGEDESHMAIFGLKQLCNK